MTRRSVPAHPGLLEPVRAIPRVVGIVGAGTIGPDIGYYLKSALPELELVLVDVREAALERARARIDGYIRKGLARGKLDAAQADAVGRNIVTTLDYAALEGCDWVLEAATEHLPLKREIFARVEAVVGPQALITSNTSSLPAARLFDGLAHPGRATVTHFFAPAFRNPAVEVIDWPGAAPDTIAFLRRFFYATGKVPMVTADVVCFMLDRIFDNWCNEAALLLDGITPAEVDSVAARWVQAGPFFVLNLAHGNPIIVETNNLQADEEGEHYRPAAVFRDAGTWETVAPGERVEVAPDKAARIADRLLGILFSQSVDILDRDIGEAADLDLGCRLAFAFRQGPLELMRALGEAEVRRILERLAAERPGMPMPRRPLADYARHRRYTLLDDVAGVKVITLRRPEALNALHEALTAEVLEVIRAHEDDPQVAGFVITGYGLRAFSAGADIGRFPAVLGDAARAAEYARDRARLLVHIDRCSKPVVAAVNGMALGGGLELAMRCHALVAVRDAWFQFPEITLGIVPGIGGMVVPYRRWPQAAATFHRMLLAAERIDAAQAHALGMVDELLDGDDALLPAAVRRVQALAGRPRADLDAPVAIPVPADPDPRTADGRPLSREVQGILARAVVEAAAAPSFEAALEIGYRAFGASACTAAAREGIAAFGERRAPDFTRTG